MEKQITIIKRNYFKLANIYSELADYFLVTPFYLKLLTIIHTSRNKCTQKYLVESFNIPKQTINSAIQVFIDKGYISLQPNPKDKREKLILLTNFGEKVISNTIGKIEKIEESVLNEFTEEEIYAYISFEEKYNKIFEQKIKENLKWKRTNYFY